MGTGNVVKSDFSQRRKGILSVCFKVIPLPPALPPQKTAAAAWQNLCVYGERVTFARLISRCVFHFSAFRVHVLLLSRVSSLLSSHRNLPQLCK